MRYLSTIKALIIIGIMAVATQAWADTHLSMDSLSADGQEVKDMDCRLAKGGMFALMQIVGELAKQKNAMHACAPAGMALRLQWNLNAGTTTQVLKSSDVAKNACILKIFAQTQFSDSGVCAATILIGDINVARQKASQMK